VVLVRTCGGRAGVLCDSEESDVHQPFPLVSEAVGSGEKLKRAETLSGEWIEIYARGCKGMHNNGSIRVEPGGCHRKLLLLQCYSVEI
jgi:hypothetical protein